MHTDDVAAEQSPYNQSGIKLFDWSTLVPQDSGHFSSDAIQNERENLLATYINSKNSPDWMEPIRQLARSYSFDRSTCPEPYEILKLSDSELISCVGQGDVKVFMEDLRNLANSCEDRVLGNFDQNSRAQIKAIADFLKKPVLTLTEKDIISPTVPIWRANRLIPAILRKDICSLSRRAASQ